MGGSGISWTICKSFAPHCRQITMLAPHHSSRHPTNSVKALNATYGKCEYDWNVFLSQYNWKCLTITSRQAAVFAHYRCMETKPRGYSIQHIPVPVPAWINWEGCGRKGIRHKNWRGIDGGGLLISPDGVATTQIVGWEAFFWHRLTRVVPEKGCKMVVVCWWWYRCMDALHMVNCVNNTQPNCFILCSVCQFYYFTICFLLQLHLLTPARTLLTSWY